MTPLDRLLAAATLVVSGALLGALLVAGVPTSHADPTGLPAQTSAPAPAQPVYTQSVQYSECFAASTWFIQGKALSKGKIPKTVKVPDGWTPVGGGGAPGNPVIFLCR